MFVIWRQKAIKSDRKTELFHEYSNCRRIDEVGQTIGTPGERWKWVNRAWAPLWCEHQGEGRVAWTPLLMHSERIAGNPRQKLLRRLPTIRSCCMADPFLLAAWWHAIHEWERLFEDVLGWLGKEGRFFERDRKAILAKLREVVPQPSRQGLQDFTAYRLEKEADEKRAEQEYFDELRRQTEANQRQQEE